MNYDNYYSGDDRGIILLHSYTSGSQDVQSLARHLNRIGYSVYTPNLSGHGINVDLDDILNYTVFEWKKDVEEAVEFMMSKGFKKVAVFGLSLGGIMSFNQLINDDRVFAGGSFSSSPVLKSLTGVKAFFMKSYTSQMSRHNIVAKSEEEIEKRLDEIFVDVNIMNKENLAAIPTFNKPVFIAQGGRDDIVDVNETITFKNMLQKNHLHFHWYDDAPHVITVGAPGNRLKTDLEAFLMTLSW